MAGAGRKAEKVTVLEVGVLMSWTPAPAGASVRCGGWWSLSCLVGVGEAEEEHEGSALCVRLSAELQVEISSRFGKKRCHGERATCAHCQIQG